MIFWIRFCGFQSVRTKESEVIDELPASLRWNFLESVSLRSAHRCCRAEGPKTVSQSSFEQVAYRQASHQLSSMVSAVLALCFHSSIPWEWNQEMKEMLFFPSCSQPWCFIRAAELSQDTGQAQDWKDRLWKDKTHFGDPELPERALYGLPTWDLKISSTSMAPDMTDQTTATTLLIKPFKKVDTKGVLPAASQTPSATLRGGWTMHITATLD